MWVASDEPFERHLRSLDIPELAEFVADVWRARGGEATVEGNTVTVTDGPNGAAERIVCVSPGRWGRGSLPEGDFDVIVTTRTSARLQDAAAETDARLLDPGRFHDLLLYGLDRGTTDRLFRTHVGRPLPAARSSRKGGRRQAEMPRTEVATFVILLGIAGMMIAGVNGGIVPFWHGPVPTASDGATDVEPAELLTNTSEDGNRPAEEGSVPPEAYPPGLGPEEVTDVDALTAAHGEVVAEVPYDLLIVHYGSEHAIASDREWLSSRQTVERVNGTYYLRRFSGLELYPNGTVHRAVLYDDFADGTFDYRRIVRPGPTTYRRGRIPTEDGEGLFTVVSKVYVRRYLATTESQVTVTLRDNQTMFRVEAYGRPTQLTTSVSNYNAVAFVDTRGMVHRLMVTYDLQPSNVDSVDSTADQGGGSVSTTRARPFGSASFELLYRDVGTTTLSSPPWYDEARNATNKTAADR